MEHSWSSLSKLLLYFQIHPFAKNNNWSLAGTYLVCTLVPIPISSDSPALSPLRCAPMIGHLKFQQCDMAAICGGMCRRWFDVCVIFWRCKLLFFFSYVSTWFCLIPNLGYDLRYDKIVLSRIITQIVAKPPQKTQLTRRNRRLPSPTRINLEEP
jgi:hypothetical protein